MNIDTTGADTHGAINMSATQENDISQGLLGVSAPIPQASIPEIREK